MRHLLLPLLLALLASVALGDLFHYYKLKKFVTAVAFARALGKRPTILPVPIPIPIPIGQNEVIKIPAGNAKTLITLANAQKYKRGGGGKFAKFTGSSPYGYALPSAFDSTLGGSDYMVLDGNSFSGSDFLSASPSVVKTVRKGLFSNFGNSDPPQRYHVLRGARSNCCTRTTRESEFLMMRPTQSSKHHSQWMQSGKRVPQQNKKRKPIPVGEKFRLP